MAQTCMACNGSGTLAFVENFSAEGSNKMKSEVCAQLQPAVSNNFSPVSKTERLQGAHRGFSDRMGVRLKRPDH